MPSATAALLAITRILTEVRDLTEALRQVCRELARFTGAETVSVHLRAPADDALVGVAAYHVPKHALPTLRSARLPLAEQGFRETVFDRGEVAWSDDVQRDPRFAFRLFRQFPHRSGLVIPLLLEREVGGAFYLVWWERPRRVETREVDTLHAVGQIVALLLHNAVLRGQCEERRRDAEAAEERHRSLVERVPVGVYRTTATGRILDANPALVQILGYPDRASFLATNAADHYVRPEDRARFQAAIRRHGVARDFTAEWRRRDGSTVWVSMNTRVQPGNGEEVYEGVIEDITARRQAELAERQAETLARVAQLASAAAHEINNPLAIVIGRLELIRRRSGDPELERQIGTVIEAGKRIAEVVSLMGKIARLELRQDSPGVPPILDLRRSSDADPRA